MAEQVALRTIEIAMSLSSEKPEARVDNLIKKNNAIKEINNKFRYNIFCIITAGPK